MSNDIRELSDELAAKELTDGQLDEVSGGQETLSLSYGKMQWVYTQQQRAD
jgi:hypothetical protein